MKTDEKIKLSKSEYIILFNILAAIVSLVLYLMGDAQITDNNGTQALSGVFVFYAAIATIWFCIFVPLDSELYDKRWLTKKEKNYTYLVFFAVSAICYVAEGYGIPLLRKMRSETVMVAHKENTTSQKG